MRVHTVSQISCSFVLVAQVFADKSIETLSKSGGHVSHSSFVKPQNAVTEATKFESEVATNEQSIFFTPFSQSLDTYAVNFAAMCEAKNREEARGSWQFTYYKARCNPSTGNNRLVEVTCHSWFNFRRGPVRWHLGEDEPISFECPERTICQRVYWNSPANGQTYEEVVCVDEADVRTELVTPANSHADPNAPNVHCGLSLALPGTEFTVKPGVDSIDITLTEEARFKDGSPYPAPMIYIRDKTSWRGFDRVFRRHASVASTQITLTAIKGRFQTRTFEFCMQLLPGVTAGAVTFSYSWFQTTNRHGRIPQAFRLAQKTNK